MKTWSRYIIAICTLYFYFGCAKVSFESAPNESCMEFNDNHGGDACSPTPQGLEFTYNVRVGEIDILFVNDNSGSMYVEQQKIANQFPNFLEDLKNFDYHVGMITTDISSSPNNSKGSQNGYGAFWDGKLLEFPNGQKFLSNPKFKSSVHNQNIIDFQKTIERDESKICDGSGSCPSSDERGIYALNKALDRPENSSFFRKGGHLAVIILSDEDERSVAPQAQTSIINKSLHKKLWNLKSVYKSYGLESYDSPKTFVKKFSQQMDSTKSLSVHSIIIKPKVIHNLDGTVDFTTGDPEGDACQATQDSQGGKVRGFYGTQYAALSAPSEDMKDIGNIVDGHIGDICANDYTSQLGPIADLINGLNFVQLPCAPHPDSIKVTMSPDPGFDIEFDIHPKNKKRLVFSPKVPAGTHLKLKFTCSASAVK